MATRAPLTARPPWQTFLAEFLKAPLKVASPFASSHAMVGNLLSGVDWSRTRTVIEYGPGTGMFTRFMLARMPADARLFAIESEAGLAAHLSAQLPDPRLTVIRACAMNAGPILADQAAGQADLLVTGLPFSSLSPGERDALVRKSAKLLKEAAPLLAYQARRAIEPHLFAHFRTVERRYEWRNLPPCHLYRCVR